MLRRENARLSGWIYVDLRGRDLQSAVEEMRDTVSREVKLPAGYSVSWSGQFEYFERAQAKLRVVVPFTLIVIFVLLYLTFRRIDEALLIMATLPFALIGGFWCIYLLGHAVSIVTAVSFIALAGVAAEFGVVMLVYLKQAWEERPASGRPATFDLLDEAIREGAVLRVRPKAMTVSVIHRRLAADHAEPRDRIGSDATDRGADDRRHDHCAAPVATRRSGGVSHSSTS